jgi:hypothetical protein
MTPANSEPAGEAGARPPTEDEVDAALKELSAAVQRALVALRRARGERPPAKEPPGGDDKGSALSA